jgi:hypothetical protein
MSAVLYFTLTSFAAGLWIGYDWGRRNGRERALQEERERAARFRR